MPDDPDDNTNATDPIVRRAHKRFLKCQRWESVARARWMADRKFANGDEYNNYQWPTDIYDSRGARPSLTVNETQQHNLHITNEAKQNKSSVKYRPVGDGATADAAEVAEGIYRHIQNISNAQMAQGVAIDFQVQAGLGYTMIESRYLEPNPKPGPEAWNQEIYIGAVDDPMSCYIDCDAREPDASDARYGFKFTDRPRDEVEEEWPELRGRTAPSNAVDGAGAWLRDDHIREARYWEVSEDADELLGDDDGVTIFRSQMVPSLIQSWEAEVEARGEKLRRRPIIRKSTTCYTIIGDKLVKTERVPGTSVPIIPWVGTVTVIDGELDRKGHTRTMLSAQRMENYNWSGSVEFVAGQTKTPWLVGTKAIEGQETYWNANNIDTQSVLVYNSVDDQGNPIPPPVRIEPPSGAPAYVEGITLARQFMLSASGQYEAEMGAPGNEISGRAINERQRQGDRATYHFVDAQALAIRRQGQIVLEWMREIYDTKRVLHILGEDGSESYVQIDPAAAAAHQKAEEEGIAGIFNPNVGLYEVVSDVGPDYATQRQEAFSAIVQILKEAPELVNRIGDLLFKVADFPLSDEISERLQPGLPPEAQQMVEQLKTALAQAQQKGLNGERLLREAMQALTEERLKVKAKDADSSIDAFKADTDRAEMLIDAAARVDPVTALRMIQAMSPEVIQQALQDNLGPVRRSSNETLDNLAMGDDIPGAVGVLPIQVPDTGRAAATPGGM